jgi:TonB-dependent SusC/RagA subfamily outer membrane receptor
METHVRTGRSFYPSWLLGALALLFVTACATTRPAQEGPSADDSVDVGYGAVDKDHVTGAVSTVSGEDEVTLRTRTLAEMLSRVPGVQVLEGPGGAMRVRVRGTSSFIGGQDPLFVVDGVVMPSATGVLNTINPNHIDSITVLKDAGETAVYGSRGANGVVLIKMKTR